jgi:TRAP-type mannitol/chloroaromatic compound transport system permease large subunit
MSITTLPDWPFEWLAIVYLFLPLVLALKVNLLWFGALVAVNL